MKKRRIRRKASEKTPGEAFDKGIQMLYLELISNKELNLDRIVPLAKPYIMWAKENEFTADSFLLTSHGAHALDLFWKTVDQMEGLLVERPRVVADVDEVTHVTATLMGAAATFWEIVLGFANPHTLREHPFEGEDLFHFLSTATFRYQFTYRALEMRYADDPTMRHAICREYWSTTVKNADIQNDTITAHIMTELWLTGVNEFHVSEALYQRFLLTDVGNIDASSMQFPYTAFMVTTPTDKLMFTLVDYPEENVRSWCLHNAERGVVQLRQDVGKDDTLNDIWEKLPEGFWDDAPEAEQACREAFQIICNLALYLQCEAAEVDVERTSVGKTPPERKRRELREYGKRTMTPVKHVLYPSLSKVASVNPGTGRSTREHWVRGHYRWQAYWPDGRKEDPVHKRIWIEPHLRGSPVDEDTDSLTSRKYKA